MPSSARSTSARSSVEDELEALRRELSQPRATEEAETAKSSSEPPSSEPRDPVETVLTDLRRALGEAADDAEELIAAHPFASVAAAFLLGVLVANGLSRGK